MMQTLNSIVFGWYPYLCFTVFLVGSLLRFDREQYTWRTGSSQLLRRRQLMWGSNLFHVGILIVLVGHVGVVHAAAEVVRGAVDRVRVADLDGLRRERRDGRQVCLASAERGRGFVRFVALTAARAERGDDERDGTHEQRGSDAAV